MNVDEKLSQILKNYRETTPAKDKNTLCLVISLLLTLIEGALVFYSFTLFLYVHSALSILLCLIIAYGSYRQWDLRFYLILLPFFVLTGPFGSCMIFISLILYRFYTITKTPLIELLRSLYPEEEQDPVNLLYERILTSMEELKSKTKPVPFQDIMSFGTITQKRNAIEKILRFYRPEFASALKRGTRDPENGIRILAATAITRLDTQYMTKFIELKNLLDADPNDPELLLQFAKHCEECAKSGILDKERTEKMIKMMINTYEKYCEIRPNDTEAEIALAKGEYLDNNPKKARDLLKTLIDTTRDIPGSAYKWLLKSLFLLHEYDAIREVIAKIKHHEVCDSLGEMTIDASIELWNTRIADEQF